MKRREFITVLGGAAWPRGARALQAAMPVIGLLSSGSREPIAHLMALFRQSLAEREDVGGNASQLSAALVLASHCRARAGMHQ